MTEISSLVRESLKLRKYYFSPFSNLWYACNNWYTCNYDTLSRDRENLDNLKSDTTRQNALYNRFKSVFSGAPDKEKTRLYTNLELLHFSLTRAEIKPEKLRSMLSLVAALIDYSANDKPEGYVDLIIKNEKPSTGKLKKRVDVNGNLKPTEENHEVVKYCYLILHDLMKGFFT